MLTSLKTLTRAERAASAMRYGVIALFAVIGIALNFAQIGHSLIRVLAAVEPGITP